MTLMPPPTVPMTTPTDADVLDVCIWLHSTVGMAKKGVSGTRTGADSRTSFES